MDKIVDKAKNYLVKLTTKAMNIKTPIKWLIFLYLIGVTFIIVAWFSCWIYSGFMEGKPDLRLLLQFIQTIIGPAMVGFVTFIAGCFVDIDNDGIPDKFESNRKENNIEGH